MYYRGAQAAVVVFDLTNHESFEGAKSWVKELQRRGDPSMIVALAGNKVRMAVGQRQLFLRVRTQEELPAHYCVCGTLRRVCAAPPQADLVTRRKVEADEAQEYAREQNLIYIETSAKESSNVERLFVDVSGSGAEVGELGGIRRPLVRQNLQCGTTTLDVIQCPRIDVA